MKSRTFSYKQDVPSLTHACLSGIIISVKSIKHGGELKDDHSDMVVIPVRMPKDLYETLRRDAFTMNKSMAEIVREALRTAFTGDKPQEEDDN